MKKIFLIVGFLGVSCSFGMIGMNRVEDEQEPGKKLLIAVKENNTKKVDNLVEKFFANNKENKKDEDAFFYYVNEALLEASLRGYFAIGINLLEVFEKHKISLDKEILRIAITLAAEHGHSAILTYLMQAAKKNNLVFSADILDHIIKNVALGGHAEVVKYLLSVAKENHYKLDKDYLDYALDSALEKKNNELAEILLDYSLEQREKNDSIIYINAVLEKLTAYDSPVLVEYVLNFVARKKIDINTIDLSSAITNIAKKGFSNGLKCILTSAGKSKNRDLYFSCLVETLVCAAKYEQNSLVASLLQAIKKNKFILSKAIRGRILESVENGKNVTLIKTLFTFVIGRLKKKERRSYYASLLLFSVAQKEYDELILCILKEAEEKGITLEESALGKALVVMAGGNFQHAVKALVLYIQKRKLVLEPEVISDALAAASKNGHLDMAMYLLAIAEQFNFFSGGNYLEDALKSAVGNNQEKIVRFLLSYAEKKNFVLDMVFIAAESISFAASSGHQMIIELLLSWLEKNNFVFSVEFVGYLESALKNAVANNQSGVVKFLLGYAEKNDFVLSISCISEEIIDAALCGNLDVIKMFFEWAQKKKLVLEKSVIEEALKNAAIYNHGDVVGFLLTQLPKNDMAKTLLYAIYFAGSSENFALMKFLFEYLKTNNLDIKKNYLQQLFSYAVKNDLKEIIFYVLANQAEALGLEVIENALNSSELSLEVKEDIIKYKKIYPVLIKQQSIKEYVQKNPTYKDAELLFHWVVQTNDKDLIKEIIDSTRIVKNPEFPVKRWVQFVISSDAENAFSLLLPYLRADWEKEKLWNKKKKPIPLSAEIDRVKKMAEEFGSSKVQKLLLEENFN